MEEVLSQEVQPVIDWQLACTYEYFLLNRYLVPRFSFQETHYEAICNNGFIKLYMPKMRAYWMVQNQFGHRLRDWKFHVSVDHQDVPRAWGALTRMFVESKCRGGMKVSYLKESQTPKGREITIYIYKFEVEYQSSELAKEYALSLADEHSQDFWVSFVDKIQTEMANLNIRANGLADGDLRLGNYVSLRNQSYVESEKVDQEHIYPPDSFGWNFNQQQLPFNLKRLGVVTASDERNSSRNVLLAVSMLLLMLVM